SASTGSWTRPISRSCASCSRRWTMETAELLQALLEATVATSAATLVVLVLRRTLRAAFGARVAYAAWALVPVSLFAVSLPTAPASMAMPSLLPVAFAVAPPAGHAMASAAAVPGTTVLVALSWLLGTSAATAVSARRQRAFRIGLGQLRRHDEGLQAETSAGLPATLGWLRPAIVLPSDFDSRYEPGQRTLMLAHE